MNVRDLIKKLEQLPPDAIVVATDDGTHYEAYGISLGYTKDGYWFKDKPKHYKSKYSTNEFYQAVKIE